MSQAMRVLVWSHGWGIMYRSHKYGVDHTGCILHTETLPTYILLVGHMLRSCLYCVS